LIIGAVLRPASPARERTLDDGFGLGARSPIGGGRGPGWSRPRTASESYAPVLPIRYLTIRYMVTLSPLGQTLLFTGLTYLVVEGTRTAPHASAGVAKKAPLQTNPLQTPAPSLANTKCGR
jgi:hypothetical protein